ncbi:MAG TPA: DUF3160 domain-containing protein [Polyangia bacterium]|nr:DUF3160 domain-containing protein [Polyangia bacterium]
MKRSWPASPNAPPVWFLAGATVLALAAALGCGSRKPGAGSATGVGTGVAGSFGTGSGGDGPDAATTGAAGQAGSMGAAGQSGADGAPATGMVDPGSAVSPKVPPARTAALTALQSQLDQGAPTDAASFAARWKPSYAASLGYDPLKALRLDAVQASHLKLNDGELALLGKNGFVTTARQAFPSFFYGYKAVYADDLPVFISADSILHTVHRSYDAILKVAENASLLPDLRSLLEGMHGELAAGGAAGLPATARRDADLYLSVARRLLRPTVEYLSQGQPLPVPVAGASAAQVDDIVAHAIAAEGLRKEPLFGDPGRTVDYSQFKPRGHYVGDPFFEAYFRAMIWLGRTDLRFIWHDFSGQPHFVRRQFEAAVALASLLDEARRSTWRGMDDLLRGFVGESDNMTVLDLETLRTTLGAATPAELVKRSDGELAQALTDGGFGIQRIASQILFVPPDGLNAPLDRVFLLFGQRYILDSEVLSSVVFDRVLPAGGPQRLLPDPLDIAFAAMGNTHAAPLLAGDLAKYKNYPAALHRARLLADAHEPAFWDGSLYHDWLGALRAMSPATDLAAATMGLPAVARTEAWSRRVLNTQLASWAELRHDTLLYAKQSYSGFPVCEYPDAYVDPYPELWAALGRYAARGTALVRQLPDAYRTQAASYFANLGTVAARLEDMARRQLTGQPFSVDQLAWVNEVVTLKTVQVGCTTREVPEGWYVNLFFNAGDVTQTAPTIADVHTNPVDAQVLHAATGVPRLMVMTAETCLGPRAYVGLASSYFEKVTTGFQRLTDEEWTTALQAQPDEIRWMKDQLGH